MLDSLLGKEFHSAGAQIESDRLPYTYIFALVWGMWSLTDLLDCSLRHSFFWPDTSSKLEQRLNSACRT